MILKNDGSNRILLLIVRTFCDDADADGEKKDHLRNDDRHDRPTLVALRKCVRVRLFFFFVVWIFRSLK